MHHHERPEVQQRYGAIRHKIKNKNIASTYIPEIKKFLAFKGQRIAEKRNKRFGIF